MFGRGGGGGSGWHTGSVDPGTGGVRDSYDPALGDELAFQAQHSVDIEREEREEREHVAGRTGLRRVIARLSVALRRRF